MVQSRTKTRVVTRNAIKVLGFAGAVSTALVAPNATELLDKLSKHMDKKSAKKTLSYLKYRQLVEVREKNGELHYRLTRKGLDKFEKILIDEISIKPPRRWDNKWRLVMFDIPVAYHKQRTQLLFRLRSMNFYMLQHSAWIHPFECEKEIGVIAKHLKLEPYISFLVVEKGNFTDHAIDRFKKADILM